MSERPPSLVAFPEHHTNLPDRYRVVRRLGAGGFGVVYEVFDRERSVGVALKSLTAISPDALYRFKKEFRSLADISHPSLVDLYDLAEHGGEWFFTMELIEGMPLPHALDPDAAPPSPYSGSRASGVTSRQVPHSLPAPPDAADPPDRSPRKGEAEGWAQPRRDRARLIFQQLADAITALHEAGRLHRDLKCGNVLVTPDDRVVVLDFGLVAEVNPTPGGIDTVGGNIIGTPLYMAPEQCAGATVGQAADWYALGVMLYRGLTGTFPFEGHTYEVLHAKQTKDAEPLSPEEYPRDLAMLCNELLRRNPAHRADGDRVRELLGPRTRGPSLPPLGAQKEVPLFGREEELATLRRAFEEARAGHPVTVLVSGMSGIGKSALVRHFVRDIVGRRRSTVVLEGRCYAQETLPYKALDGVIDSLARYLRQLSDDAVMHLVPRHVADLVQLFPVLRRVDSFEKASEGIIGIPDAQERQRRAFHALRELLGSISDRNPLTIFVDDLQWGDAASAAVFRRISTGVDAPSLLFIGTYRSEDTKRSAFLAELETAEAELEVSRIELGDLREDRARALAERLLEDGDAAWAEEIARESLGNPLFIDVLTRHANLRALDTAGGAPPPAPARLADVIRATVAELPDEERRLLELLSVSARPVTPIIARNALSIEALSPSVVARLRSTRLLRSRGTGKDEELECYHDRIRETIEQSLSADAAREHHRAYALALDGTGSEDYESLAIHYRAAGEATRAFHNAVKAADRASLNLAFARAARLYRLALELGSDVGDGDEHSRIRLAMADAYRLGGRGAEAAHAYFEAAEGAPAQEALHMRHRAAEQLLFSGHMDEGKAAMSEVLRAVGLRMPGNEALAMMAFAGRRAQVRVRGLAHEVRPVSEIDADRLLRIDVAWSVAIGLSMVDPIRAGSFQAHHLLLALDAGDPVRIAKAVAVEIPFCATAGSKNRKRTAELETLAQRLTANVDDPFVKALTDSCMGGACWLEGRWAEAVTWQKLADERIRRECTGAAWQLATITIVWFDSLYRLGEFEELFTRLDDVLADAQSRGDLFLEVYLRIKFRALAYLAQGDPDGAEEELDEAIARWSTGSFTLLSFWHLYARVEIDLYRGQPHKAKERLERNWGAVKKSLLLTLQLYRVSIWDLRGRVEVACAAASGNPHRHLKAAQSAARTLRKEKTPWATLTASVVGAGAASVLGRRDRARHMSSSAKQEARATKMGIHTRLAELRWAQLGSGTADREEAARARRSLEKQRLADVDAWASVVYPGSFGE